MWRSATLLWLLLASNDMLGVLAWPGGTLASYIRPFSPCCVRMVLRSYSRGLLL